MSKYSYVHVIDMDENLSNLHTHSMNISEILKSEKNEGLYQHKHRYLGV